MTVSASVVVPTWRRLSGVSSILDALSRQDDRDFEIVVVSDGDDTDLREFSKTFESTVPVRWIFHPDNRGLPAARNTGVAESVGKLILFLDDDMIPSESWLRHHRERHAIEGSNTIVLGNLTEEFELPADSRLEAMLRKRRAKGYSEFFARAERNGGTFEFTPHCGNNSSLTREVFDLLGGFDESQRDIHEDLEMGERAYEAGMRFVYEPLARAVHRNSRTALSYEDKLSRAAAISDVRRIRDKRQRVWATAGIRRLEEGSLKTRTRERLALKMPGLIRHSANLITDLASKTGSVSLLDTALGMRRSVEYWGALKADPQNLTALSSLRPEPSTALVIHAVSGVPVGEERRYHMGRDRFKASMRAIAQSGFVARGVSSMVAPNGMQHRAPRLVALTFDDGYEDFFTEAFPVLQSLGLTATVFVVAGLIGRTSEWDTRRGYRGRRLLTREQIVELHRHGIEIGSHSMTHPRLTELGGDALDREVSDSKKILEDLVGNSITSFAYPGGDVNERVRAAVARAGYASAYTTREGINGGTDRLLLNRAALSDIDTLASLMLKLRTGRGFAGHARRAAIAISKASLSILPHPVEENIAKRLKDADAKARRRQWKKRTLALESAASSHEDRSSR